MTLEGGLDDLKALQDVMTVYEELGNENEEELDDLVTPYRRLFGAHEIILKEAPFASAKGEEAKVFLFNDIVLIGLNTKKLGKSGRAKRSGTLDKKKKKGTLTIKKGTLTRFKGQFKLYHYLLLDNCKTKRIGEDKDGFQGIQLTHVSRWQEASKKGTMKVVTKIAKLEMWFPSKEICDEMDGKFIKAMQTLEEEANETGSEPGSRFSLTRTPSGASRKWANGRARRTTLEKSRPSTSTLTDDDETCSISRNGSIHSHGGDGASIADSVGGLQLADLEERYNVDMKAFNEENDKTEVDVEFGEGALGFSLGSSAGIGVVVGKLQKGGFAEFSGVLVSDRVVQINDVEIGLDDHWQEVISKLKTFPRPVRIKFERYGSRSNQVLKNSGEDKTKAKAPSTKGQDSVGASKTKAKELEKILLKAERIVARGPQMDNVLKAICDSEDVKASSSSRKLAAVLDEIAKTEIAYVKHMCDLVKTYILPLRNERVKTKCRQIDGSLVCDHGILRSTCLRSAREHQPIISTEELLSIFLNIETIIFVNIELVRLLINTLNTLSAGGKVPKLDDVVAGYADAFTKVIPFMKSYSYFCHYYPDSQDKIVMLRKDNKAIGAFLHRIERQAMDNHVQSLASLFIKPVQRLCKYPLLFNELLKHAPESMSGRKELELAADQVDLIANQVNRKVGESQQFEKFMEIYRDLGGEIGAPGLVVPSRRFVLEVDCMVQMAPYEENQLQPRTLFLFNDLIVLAKGETGTLSRPKSLQRMSLKRGASSSNVKGTLERTWSSFVRAFTGNEKEPEPKHLSRKASLKKMRAFKLTRQFELGRLQIAELQKDHIDPKYGFTLTAKERVLVENENPSNKKGTGTWKTNINKYTVTFDEEHLAENTQAKIKECVSKLKELGKGHVKGEEQFGKKRIKREWTKRSNTLRAKVKD